MVFQIEKKFQKFPKFYNFENRRIFIIEKVKKKLWNFWNCWVSKISKFSKFHNLYNYQNSKNFKFDGKLSYILSVRTIQSNVNIRNKFEKKNRVARFSLFPIISIFEVSDFQNIGGSTFVRSKFWSPPVEINVLKGEWIFLLIYSKIKTLNFWHT